VIIRLARSLVVVVFVVVVCVLLAANVRHQTHSTALKASADRIVVKKAAHTMILMRQGQILSTYQVALGRGGQGNKQRAGDNKVPEGTYYIVSKNPQSAFHKALRVGYPTPAQRRVAQTQGIDPGGDIMIHGIRNGLGWIGALHHCVDWTKGCIAVTNPEMDAIWRAVPVSTPVEITP
jgi:murein L,D-transpeptidase YafK